MTTVLNCTFKKMKKTIRRIKPGNHYLTFILCAAFFYAHASMGQNVVLEFEKTTHNFGNIQEMGGPVSYEFKFTNKGTAPLVIGNVRASCGCTTPGWSKEPVEPGKSGYIKAQFEPLNRPGVFDKSLTVTSNAEPATVVLRIQGMVIPRSKSPADEYPDSLGNLRIRSKNLNFSSVTTKEPVAKEFNIYNNGEAPISFSNVSAPKHLKVAFTPTVLPPKTSGMIKVLYDAKLKNDFGEVSDVIVLSTNDPAGAKKILNVGAVISEYFPALSGEALEEAPRISIPDPFYDYGSVKAGSGAVAYIDIANTGKETLMIRKVKSPVANLIVSPVKTELKPGQNIKLKVILGAANLTGSDTKTVSVYSNDPVKPVQTIQLKYSIVND
jgi:hypothetical protein